MTSVVVISSAVARIKCLKESKSLPRETDELLNDLEEIKKLLEAAAHGQRTESAAKAELVKQVVRLSYEIVDAITDEAPSKPKEKHFMGNMLNTRKKSGNTNLSDLKEKLRGFWIELQQNNHGEGSTAATSGSETRVQTPNKSSETQGEKKLLNRQELLNLVREQLLNPDSSEPVYLVGESGMGKTTLANKLYNDHQLRDFFEVFAWVPITHNFQIKGVLQVLLQQLSPQLNMREMNEIELINRIFAQLKDKKYLIVLDDINTADDWESIRLALPIANSARVLITTSSDEIGNEEKDHRYKISGLSKPEVLRLLEEEAGFKPGSKEVGKAIFDISGGSPLFATILGNSLVAEATASTASEQQLVNELSTYNSVKGMSLVLGAGYKRLPTKLKPCLLYLGQFPPGQDIQVDKLYLLLMAENLISPEVFEKEFLDELARLKLIHVQQDILPTMTSGHYKSCRLHDQVRDFCRLKGLDEEFLEVVELPSSTKVQLHTRRLAVYLRGENCSIQFDSPDTVKKILSLLIFDTFESDVEKSEMNDLTEFIHLRILNYEGVNFKVRKILKGLDRLVLLTYLSFRGCLLEELPSSMSNLTQLETLDLLVQANCDVIIPSNMFTNMKRMVHLYLPRLCRTSDGGKTKLKLQQMDKLEILDNFNTEMFEVKALSHLNKLKILSTISGNPKDLVEVTNFITAQGAKVLQHSSVDITSFDCYNNASVKALKELLQDKSVRYIRIEGQIGKPEDTISCAETVGIGEMVLNGSELQLDPMPYLGKFQNLRRLALTNNAFLGTHIRISAAPLFPNLKSLKLLNLQFLEKITIEKEAMPMLSALQIHCCASLSAFSIPKELDDRLQKARRDNGVDAYSLMPFPSGFNIVPKN